jgi:hypothetical protein
MAGCNGLAAGHLVRAPSLQMWRCNDELHLHWKSAQGESETPAWSSPNGRATTNASAFREELIKFDRELIAAMESRVSEIERNWNRPEITIDVEDLRRDHADRALSLQRTFERPRYREPSWDEIVKAVIAVDKRIG